MQNALKSNEWRRIWVLETFKIEIQKGRPNNSAFCGMDSPKKLGPASLIFRNLKSLRKLLLSHADCIQI